MAALFFLFWLFAAGLVLIPPVIGFLLALFPFSRVLGRRVLWGYVGSMFGAVGGFIAAQVVWVFAMAIYGPDRFRDNTGFLIVSFLGWVAATFGGYVLGFFLGWRYLAPGPSDAGSAPSPQPPPLLSPPQALSIAEKIAASAILAPLAVLLLGLLVFLYFEPTVPVQQRELVTLVEQRGMILLYLIFFGLIWKPQRSARPCAAANCRP